MDETLIMRAAAATANSSNTIVSSNFSTSSSSMHNPHQEWTEKNSQVHNNLCSNCEKALICREEEAATGTGKTRRKAKRIVRDKDEDDPEKIRPVAAAADRKAVVAEESFEGVELNPPPKGINDRATDSRPKMIYIHRELELPICKRTCLGSPSSKRRWRGRLEETTADGGGRAGVRHHGHHYFARVPRHGGQGPHSEVVQGARRRSQGYWKCLADHRNGA